MVRSRTEDAGLMAVNPPQQILEGADPDAVVKRFQFLEHPLLPLELVSSANRWISTRWRRPTTT